MRNIESRKTKSRHNRVLQGTGFWQIALDRKIVWSKSKYREVSLMKGCHDAASQNRVSCGNKTGCNGGQELSAAGFTSR
jgi:hypothetical protein